MSFGPTKHIYVVHIYVMLNDGFLGPEMNNAK